MLNFIEKSILEAFINVYELNLKNQIINSANNLNINFDEEHIPNKLIDIFFNKYGKFLPQLLHYSCLYSIGFCEASKRMKYLNYIEYYKNDINELNKVDIEFKRMCLINAIKYLINKKNDNVSLLKEDECLREYSSYFQYINNYETIYTLKEIERITLFKLFEKYNPLDKIKFILELIETNKYDEDIYNFNKVFIGDISKVKFFKKYLLRMIMVDAYIIHSNAVKEKEEELFSIPFFSSKNAGVLTPELMFMNNCIANKKFTLPNEEFQRSNIIKPFLICLTDSNYRNDNLEKVEKDKKKELSLIDPFYKIG